MLTFTRPVQLVAREDHAENTPWPPQLHIFSLSAVHFLDSSMSRTDDLLKSSYGCQTCQMPVWTSYFTFWNKLIECVRMMTCVVQLSLLEAANSSNHETKCLHEKLLILFPWNDHSLQAKVRNQYTHTKHVFPCLSSFSSITAESTNTHTHTHTHTQVLVFTFLLTH